MKTSFLYVFCLLCLTSLGQKHVELYGGLNYNNFRDGRANEGYYQSDYDFGQGYAFGISVDSVRLDWLLTKFSLEYVKYSGSIKVSDGGHGSTHTTEAAIHKSVLSLAVYPINFQLFKRIDWSIGLEVSQLVAESFEGKSYGWSVGQPSWNEDLEQTYTSFNRQRYAGMKVNV